MPDPMNDRDIVIVFGAGASYGAGHVLPAAPPLGLVTRPRAADDFASIRARMEELRRERAPRAADDFAAIRARMEELRRERAQMSAARDARPLCPRPYGLLQRRFLACNSSKGLQRS
jgi:hypothetical protein